MVIYGLSVVNQPLPNYANLYLNVLHVHVHVARMCSPELHYRSFMVVLPVNVWYRYTVHVVCNAS